jgi:hypothetical protein
MTEKSQVRPITRVASRSGACALYRYYYGYFAAGAETV